VIMPVVKNNETYYTAAEAAQYLGISRDTFYRSVRQRLTGYQLGVFKRTYYRKSDLDALQQGVYPVEPEEEDL
jgi:excisionase family DNA binding protein